MQLSNLYNPWAVDNTRWGIEITEGKFKDTIIQIENIDFAKADTGDLIVDFHAVNLPDTLVKEDLDSSDFTDTMQLIISDIISNAISEFEKSNNDN